MYILNERVDLVNFNLIKKIGSDLPGYKALNWFLKQLKLGLTK